MSSKEDLILESALELFLKFGYKKTNIDQIAKHAGIGKGTIYNYYKNKEVLFKTAADKHKLCVDQETNEAVKKIDGARKKLIRRAQLQVLSFQKIFQKYAMTMEIFEELLSVMLDDQQFIYRINKETAEILELGEQEGDFRGGDHMESAKQIFEITTRFFPSWIHSADEKICEDIEKLYNFMIDGISVK